MSMSEEEENRIRKLEEDVDVLTKRLDNFINGVVDTIKNYPIWKNDKISEQKNEEKVEKDTKMVYKNTERIDKHIIGDVRENLGVARNDSLKDDEINRMSLNEIFSRWCEWNGYINLSKELRKVIGNIYGIDIESRTIIRQDI
jgi:hypothetical protein